MQRADYLVLAAYLSLVLLIGARFARQQRSNADFFLAGRSMHWFPVGLSIMATAFTGVNYIAFSGEVSTWGLYVLMCLPIFAAVSLPVTRVIMPFFYRLRLCSAYEYLEWRFDVKVRCLASGLFITWQVFWMATVIYVPCKVLGAITGAPEGLLIALVGLTTAAYTLAGGLKAVIWMDVLQFAVFSGSIVFGVLLAAARLPGGFAGLVHTAAADGLLKPFYPFDPQIFSPDPHLRITLWSCWLGTAVAFLARYGADQTVVQRYFAARSLAHAQRAFRLNYLSAILCLLSLALMGLAIHAHAASAGIIAPGKDPVAYFVAFVQSLAPGAAGLIVAGLLAATMSVDSGINSCCTAFTVDFYNRFGGRAADEVRRSRLLSAGFGIAATLAALSVGRLGTIFEIANKVINGLGSPLLALFLLGMFSRRANTWGVLVGGALGAVWSGWVSFGVQGLALHYYAVLNLAGTLALGYLGSLVENWLRACPSPAQLGWTWRVQGQAGEGW